MPIDATVPTVTTPTTNTVAVSTVEATKAAAAVIVAEKTQPYWFKQPVALFAPGGSWKNYFPSFKAPLLGPRNVNAITRITLIIIIIVAIAMRSWWPVAIGAGVLLLIVLIAYGWDVYQRKKVARALGTEAVIRASESNASAPETNTIQNNTNDVLSDKDDNAAILRKEAYYHYSRSPTPLFVDQNGIAVVDDAPQDFAVIEEVAAEETDGNEIRHMPDLLDGFEPQPESSTPNKKPPITFGVDPRTVQATMQSEDMPATYRRSTARSDVDAIDSIYGGPVGERASKTPQKPLTQTERMLEQMHKDVSEYFWDEAVAKRAPRWQQDPNDPRTRRKAEQDELERGSWRGFQWSNGP